MRLVRFANVGLLNPQNRICTKLDGDLDGNEIGLLLVERDDQHLQTSCCFNHRSLVVMLLGHPGIGVLQNGRRNSQRLVMTDFNQWIWHCFLFGSGD
jgi:hypothetical protein